MLRKATVYCILFLQFTQAFADCLMFVISAPSGVGKDTMADMLKEKYHQLQPVLSVTDRPIRTNEVDLLNGYKFVSTEEFNKMKKDGELLNPLVSYGYNRATWKKSLNDVIKSGNYPLFVVNAVAYNSLKQEFSKQCRVVGLYLLPPSVDALYRRLTKRGTETADVVKYRMNLLADEVVGCKGYDYIIKTTNDISTTFDMVDAVYKAEMLKLNAANADMYIKEIKEQYANLK